MQGSLPFPFISDERRLRFAEMLNDRPLSDRARKFLRLAFDGLTEFGKPGLRVRYYDNALLISCPQTRLAELLECSVRTVQRMIAGELEQLNVLESAVTVPKTDGPPTQRTVYLVFLDRLEALPVLDPTDELDSVILDRNGDLRQDGSRQFSHPECDVASDVVSVVASDVVSVVAPVVVSPMNHDHEMIMNINPMNHDHGDQRSESETLPESQHTNRKTFLDLTNETVRAIVRGKDLQTLLQLDEAGRDAFDWPPGEQEQLNRLAMWHHAATHRRIENPAAVLKARMRDRDWRCLKQADSDWAAAMLRERSRGSPAKTPVTLQLNAADCEPETMAAQQRSRAANLQALAAMQRQRQEAAK